MKQPRLRSQTLCGSSKELLSATISCSLTAGIAQRLARAALGEMQLEFLTDFWRDLILQIVSEIGYLLRFRACNLRDGHHIQTELIINYYSNIEEYPKWQKHLKEHQPRILVVWGKNDQIFLPSGAEAYKRDVQKTEIHFYHTGHFAPEKESTDIAKQIQAFYR